MAYDGHGMTERAPASQSIAHVMAHERAHINSYRTRAFQEGYVVTGEDIGIRFEMRDGVIVAVAGEARATLSREAPEPESAQQAPARPEATLPDDAEPAGPSQAEGLEAPAAASDAAIARHEQAAVARLRDLESQLLQLPRAGVTPEQQEQIRSLEGERAGAEQDLRDAELARQTAMLAKMIARQNSLIAGALDAQTRIAARIAYGAQTQAVQASSATRAFA